MNYVSLYEDILFKLKNNQRPKVALSLEQIEEIKHNWSLAIVGDNLNHQELIKILCILDHTQYLYPQFQELILSTFKKNLPPEIIIYSLSASQKHIVEESLRSGNMIPMDYFDILKTLLQNNNPEILEWTLRTIESMGALSWRLQKDVRASRPGVMKYFNQHQKAAAQIIDLLEKQWEKMRL